MLAVETFERDQDSQEQEIGAEESGSESVPGSVEVQRGRGRYKKPRLVSYENARRSGAGLGIGQEMQKGRKRRYDSGIGMEAEEEYEDVVYDEDLPMKERNQTGMLTPELSSDVGIEGDVVGVMA